MSKPRSICVYCGSDRHITKQHIIPNRVRRILPRDSDHYNYRTYTFERTAEHTQIRFEPRRKPGHLGTRKLRAVCYSCNNGWIREVEEDAFPLVELLVAGAAPVLSPNDVARLRMLCCTIFTMIDLVDERGTAVSQAERTHIRKTLSPPDTWQLYLGRADSREWQLRYRHHSAVSLPHGVLPNGEKSNVQVSTVVIGKLLLHVISTQKLPRFIAKPLDYAKMFGIAELGEGREIDVSVLPVLNTDRIEAIAEKIVSKVIII